MKKKTYRFNFVFLKQLQNSFLFQKKNNNKINEKYTHCVAFYRVIRYAVSTALCAVYCIQWCDSWFIPQAHSRYYTQTYNADHLV